MSDFIDAFYRLMDRNGWLLLFMAGFFEILWALFLKMSDGYTKMGPTLATIPLGLFSAALLSMAMRTLPLGTSYAIWIAIGAIGAVGIGTFYYGEHITVSKMLCVGLIVAGVVGLKMLDLMRLPPA